MHVDPQPQTEPVAAVPHRSDVEVGLITHEGKVRENNEDAFSFFEPADADLFHRKGRILVIADGMGGHLAGEVASKIAVNTVLDAYLSHPSDDPRISLGAALRTANETIFRRANENPEERGMGTTCTAFVLRENTIYTAHVGDSRGYVIRGRQASQITQDHATPHGLLRALGAEESVEVDVLSPLAVEPADSYVLCSDGLTRYLDGVDIRNILAAAETGQAACEKLVERALDEGGIDNITILILKIMTVTSNGGPSLATDDTQPIDIKELESTLPLSQNKKTPDSLADTMELESAMTRRGGLILGFIALLLIVAAYFVYRLVSLSPGS